MKESFAPLWFLEEFKYSHESKEHAWNYNTHPFSSSTRKLLVPCRCRRPLSGWAFAQEGSSWGPELRSSTRLLWHVPLPLLALRRVADRGHRWPSTNLPGPLGIRPLCRTQRVLECAHGEGLRKVCLGIFEFPGLPLELIYLYLNFPRSPLHEKKIDLFIIIPHCSLQLKGRSQSLL